MVLIDEVNDLNENYQKGPRKNKLPEWISKLSQDAAKVKTKRGRLASNGANMENATRKGWEVVHGRMLNR
jgi:hypothetical protein